MDKLLNLYGKVFDDTGAVKLCGREACKDLIMEMNKHYPYINFGDIKTGIMRIDIIKEYVDKYKEEKH